MKEINQQGFVIAFEGGDGTGKSTLAQLLAKKFDAVLLREPGGTTLGNEIRDLVQNRHDLKVSSHAEMLLYAADRAQMYDEVVKPAIENGKIVVQDRSLWSSVGFQHGSRGIAINDVLTVNKIALREHFPDFVIFLDRDPKTALKTVNGRGKADRIELEGVSFQQKAREVFLHQAAIQNNWLRLEAMQDLDMMLETTFNWIQTQRERCTTQ